MSDLKSHFDEHGYIAYKSLLDAEEMAEVQKHINRFVAEVAPVLPEDIAYYEVKGDLSTLKQVQKLYDYDAFFLRLAKSESIVGLAEALLGGAVELQNMQYFNKVPGIGEATPPHQDGYYFKIKPQEAVTMWLSLGDADASNGAMCYVRGSHKKGLRNHSMTSTLGFSQEITDWNAGDEREEVQMVAKAGDMLVHHCLTIHRANNNGSTRDRKSIGFIFYRHDVEIDEQSHTEYAEKLRQALTKQGKI